MYKTGHTPGPAHFSFIHDKRREIERVTDLPPLINEYGNDYKCTPDVILCPITVGYPAADEKKLHRL